jgi:hypothetical protein
MTQLGWSLELRVVRLEGRLESLLRCTQMPHAAGGQVCAHIGRQ